MTTVSVAGLVKSYGAVRAVDAVSFTASAGEVLAFLGPNGAGKTTTFECLEGLRRPDAGTLDVLGCRPGRDARRLAAVLGVQLQVAALPPTMTPLDAVRLFSAIHGVKPALHVLERFQLGERMRQPYRELSVGWQRRLGLALALAHDPRVVVLDEPTAGLDVESRAALHEVIRALRAEGRTLLLATHDMAEAEALADRIVVLIRGRIVATGTPRELTAGGAGLTRVSVATAKHAVTEEIARALPGVDAVRVDGDALVLLSRDASDTVEALVRRVRESDDKLTDLRVERPSLEERFLEIARAAEAAP